MVISSSSSSTPRPFLLPILLIIICFSAAFSVAFDDDPGDPTDDHYLGHTCSSPTSGSIATYLQSLASLVDDLANAASTPGVGGFSWMSTRAGDRVYALAQCRLDLDPADCKNCVHDAATEVTQTHCPKSRSAAIWRDYCELKYSDVEFFGKVDTDSKLTITDGLPLSSGSQQAANALLSGLTQTALRKSPFFKNGTSGEAGGPKIYGMVQCTGDVNGNDCRTCLDRAVSDLSKCCGTFGGARVNFGSCNVRRETYRFLKDF